MLFDRFCREDCNADWISVRACQCCRMAAGCLHVDDDWFVGVNHVEYEHRSGSFGIRRHRSGTALVRSDCTFGGHVALDRSIASSKPTTRGPTFTATSSKRQPLWLTVDGLIYTS